VLVLSVLAQFVSGGTAHADAVGTVPIGGFEYTWEGAKFTVPTGAFLTHAIFGEGRRVTRENAGVDSIGPALYNGGFCNWRIDFQYQDTNGKVYGTDRGPTENRCNHYTFREIRGDRSLSSYGKACALFYVSGAERARQCHFIVKAS